MWKELIKDQLLTPACLCGLGKALPPLEGAINILHNLHKRAGHPPVLVPFGLTAHFNAPLRTLYEEVQKTHK